MGIEARRCKISDETSLTFRLDGSRKRKRNAPISNKKKGMKYKNSRLVEVRGARDSVFLDFLRTKLVSSNTVYGISCEMCRWFRGKFQVFLGVAPKPGQV